MISSDMPIYDYRCDHCGHVFSAVQSFSDEALSKCPNCGKRPRRLLSTPAIVFKGSGWYKTDSRPAEKSEESTSATDKTEKKDEKPKSETKPAEAKPAASPKSEAAS
jgi:putative FmdB family regulatory protein